MKSAFAVFVISLLTLSAWSQEKVKWMSWEEAVAATKENPKHIFVDTYTSWCGWCKTMDRNTFANPVIASYMNEHYYAVKMNAEMKDTIVFNGYTFVNPKPNAKRSAHQLAASLLDNRMSYPSFIILNQKVERIQIIPGYKSPKDFEPIIRYFIEGATKQQPYEEYMKDFDSLLSDAQPKQ